MTKTEINKNKLPGIQGLRAIAVLAVLLFHIWPNLMPGGYVGVDVFFVISGYLITGLLLREAQEFGKISLLDFYSRRIIRLLPAAVLVILVSSFFVGLLPQVQWPDIAKEMVASTIYMQNWWLAYQSVDYLAEDSAQGLLRHYWSLSVEEQYYIFWPIMIMLAMLVKPALQKFPERIVFFLALTVGLMSLIYSIYLTNHNPPMAYFSTTTRAWELALGSGLTVLIPKLVKTNMLFRATLGWLGLALITSTFFIFSETTKFPGYLALIPTLGTALVIFSGQTSYVFSVERFLRPICVQYLGDISYSLYLWHWPVLLIYKSLLINDTGLHHGFVVLGISILLAHFTKIWVEDPFRQVKLSPWKGLNFSWVIFATSLVAVALVAAVILYVFQSKTLSTKSIGKINASILTIPYNPQIPTIPSVNYAKEDNPDVYHLKCHVNQVSSEPKSCSFGLTSARHTIVLVGDSHAAQWLPTIQEIFKNRPDWKIVTFTKSACAFNAATVTIGKGRQPYSSCSEWNKRVLSKLDILRPDIVVTSSSSGYHVNNVINDKENLDALVDGLLVNWEQLLRVSKKVVVIRETPKMEKNVPECMSGLNATLEQCSVSLQRVMRNDPIFFAVQRKPQSWDMLSYADLTEQICEAGICKPVSGQILIWRDSHHLTATFARLLASKLEPFLINDHK